MSASPSSPPAPRPPRSRVVPPSPWPWLAAAAAVSLLCLLVYAAVQQVYRRGADDPQIQLAEDAAARLLAGAEPGALLTPGPVDLARSLAPFVTVLDRSGAVEASSAEFRGRVPVPPRGALEAARGRGENRISWQPARGVRSAIVIVAVPEPRGGWVVAGRSLREVERREEDLGTLVRLAWIAALAALAVGWWSSRARAAS